MKKFLAVTTACALFSAIAVPALALENEFHGMFRTLGTINNYAAGGAGGFLPEENAATRTLIEQRARLMYIAKANDDLKLVTQFEIDSRWGDAAYGNGRNTGGAIGADQVNLETKNVYLDFNVPAGSINTSVNAKVGIQPWIDSYGGILVNADMAGALVSAKFDGFTNSFGWFRFDDERGSLPGKANRDFLVIDSKRDLAKGVKVGGSYYLLADDRSTSDNTLTHMVGLNGEFQLDPVTLGVFGMYQFGDTAGVPDSDLSAYAFGATAKAKAGRGVVKTSLLYVSGDKTTGEGKGSNAFQVVSSESTFYPADMQILLRNKWSISSDRGLVQDLNGAKDNEGLMGAFIGYDVDISSRLFANANAGVAAAANAEGDNFLGTEVNAEAGYRLFDNLTASVQGAYFVLGGYYDDGPTEKADNPYQARVMLNYVF